MDPLSQFISSQKKSKSILPDTDFDKYFAELESVQEKRINFVTRMSEPRPPFWRMKVPRILLSWTVLAVLCTIVSISLLGVILYRMSMIVALSAFDKNDRLQGNINYFDLIFNKLINYSGFESLTISLTGALINLILILVLSFLYDRIAVWLTDKELHR